MPNRQSQPDFHSFLNTQSPGYDATIVPQRIFVAQGQFTPKRTIRFSVGGRPGVNLASAFHTNQVNIDNGRNIADLSDTAKKITMRINWPGYEPWSWVIHVFDHTYDANPVTIQKLAHFIAKGVNLLKTDYAQTQCTAEAQGWGLHGFRLENIVLLEFRHVSPGSWQPVFCLAQ